MSLMLIHEISAAEERNKKWGAENKIGHSILSNERQSVFFSVDNIIDPSDL